MCQAFNAERSFVASIDAKFGRCEVCGRGNFWHDWRCEAHPRHEEWKASPMYRPEPCDCCHPRTSGRRGGGVRMNVDGWTAAQHVADLKRHEAPERQEVG